jgi:putative acetyltransferase
MSAMTIRPEQPGDEAAIDAVHKSAFPAEDEAKLVAALRSAGRLSISLVAVEGERIVGHIAFSPVAIDGVECGLGLAPVAVVPEYQRKGIGGKLVQEGLAAAKQSGTGFVVVLGHPEYYPRFGFHRASSRGLNNVYGVDDAFMVMELKDGALSGDCGLVTYGPEFGVWE